MKLREQKGFTLIEVIVVAGIIAVLAGILVPLIFKEIDESKISRAAADVRSISAALIVMKKDTGNWPVTASCTPDVTLIHGAGALPPLVGGWNASTLEIFDNYLNNDSNNCWPNTWKGPYIATVTPDPWGNQYLLNANYITMVGVAPIWIISAGPNGIVETPPTNTVPGGDDIGLRLR
ncbi:MAG: type II secretion system protein GspG [Nitrospirae bacterium]|nr:type II secretion system protein GspG [Nitrospirota bacterium]